MDRGMDCIPKGSDNLDFSGVPMGSLGPFQILLRGGITNHPQVQPGKGTGATPQLSFPSADFPRSSLQHRHHAGHIVLP